jgi:ribosomal-protein-alanine N-acetyltransferase
MSEGALEVVRVTPDDLDAVAALDARAFAIPWTQKSLAQDVARDGQGTWCRLLREGGEVVAYLIAWWLLDEVHVVRVAVDPAHRRRGHARRLVEALVLAAGHSGARLVTLEVRASNVAAWALYGSLAFAVVGRRPGYYDDVTPPEDAILLTRWIDPPPEPSTLDADGG